MEIVFPGHCWCTPRYWFHTCSCWYLSTQTLTFYSTQVHILLYSWSKDTSIKLGCLFSLTFLLTITKPPEQYFAQSYATRENGLLLIARSNSFTLSSLGKRETSLAAGCFTVRMLNCEPTAHASF